MEKDHFRDIPSVREYTKVCILQVLNQKKSKLPLFPYLFKDFPDKEKLNFGMKVGLALTAVLMMGKQYDANPDVLNMGVREAAEDLNDELRTRYEQLE